ncbi:MAG: hypothetical protein GF334_01010, partial [Candidatus Altiarchaeales archaeon]|nr:hypothetical protein [Candidatus Altiarchaeales archaeon]
EMVKAVPEVKSLKRILVLFNIEFLEYLINGAGVKPSKIEFGYDSELEGKFAQDFYKVKTFPVGSDIDQMKLALDGKGGRYDVVFSNPPYQVQSVTQKGMKGNGSTHASAIYHEIVMYAIDVLQPQYVCMITPSRWMAGGRGLDDYRKRMLADKHIRMIQDFPTAKGPESVFDGANLPGGVSYFLWDRDYSNGCEFNGIQRDIGEFDVLVRDNVAHQILKKVLAKHEGAFCDTRVLPTIPFGLTTNFSKWVDKTEPCSTPCYARRRSVYFVKEEDFTDYHGVRSLWKIYGARGTGHNGEIFSKERDNIGYRNVFLGEKGSICTQTYLVLASFRKKEDAIGYLRYTQTKFFQFLMSLRTISQMVSSDKFAWVPDLGDYSKAWTDEELYEHFGLTKQERDHIEKTIKSLD